MWTFGIDLYLEFLYQQININDNILTNDNT